MYVGAAAVDGFFAVKRNRFGCPPTLARKELIVCPFLPSSVNLNPWETATDATLSSLPGSNSTTLSSSSSSSSGSVLQTGAYTNTFDKTNKETATKEETETESETGTLFQPPPPTLSYDLLTPALLSPSDWPFSMSDLFQLALGPPNLRYPSSM